jgi:hypothetical protein
MSPAFIGYETRWVLELIQMLWRREKPPAPSGIVPQFLSLPAYILSLYQFSTPSPLLPSMSFQIYYSMIFLCVSLYQLSNWQNCEINHKHKDEFRSSQVVTRWHTQHEDECRCSQVVTRWHTQHKGEERRFINKIILPLAFVDAGMKTKTRLSGSRRHSWLRYARWHCRRFCVRTWTSSLTCSELCLISPAIFCEYIYYKRKVFWAKIQCCMPEMDYQPNYTRACCLPDYMTSSDPSRQFVFIAISLRTPNLTECRTLHYITLHGSKASQNDHKMLNKSYKYNTKHMYPRIHSGYTQGYLKIHEMFLGQ